MNKKYRLIGFFFVFILMAFSKVNVISPIYLSENVITGLDETVIYDIKTSNGNPNVTIYVNSTIASNINSQVQRFVQDITAQGYNVTVVNWSLINVNLLKANITSYYANGLEGVILIGELPYAMANYWETNWAMRLDFPTDLYLMDLDGLWQDIVTPDGKYEIDQGEHLNGTGDWEPEIWLARISPYSMGMPGINYTQELIDYFNRNHDYRTGIISRPNKACLYIDDDWSSVAGEWISNFTAYTGSELDSFYTNALTTSIDYHQRIQTTTYEFVHLLVHSYPTQHAFGPGGNGADGYLTYNDIWTKNNLPFFYNLYACFSGNYSQQNNTATYYLFSNDTLTVIGSSRSGGMDLYQPFYDNLSTNETIGRSFYNWFYNPEIEALGKAQLYYGMTIFGDPLLTIHMYDPIVESITITNPTTGTKWYKGSTHEITWTSSGGFTNVDITLWNSSGLVLTIKGAAQNNGSFFWTIPNNLNDGMDYYIRLDDMDGIPSNNSAYFTIEVEPTNGDGTPGGISGPGILLISGASIFIAIYLVKTNKKNVKIER